MELLKCLPPAIRAEMEGLDFSRARQLRLRVGRPYCLEGEGAPCVGQTPLSAEVLRRVADALTGHALQSLAAQTAQGFAPLPGGCRLGLCGTFSMGRLRDITSLCLRFSREIRTAGEGVTEKLFENGRLQSALIVGAPGTGKTTLLRDLVRRLSEGGLNVAVADERGEIGGMTNGAPQMDVGPNTDVMDGMPKRDALLLLTRALAPDALAADELGSDDVFAALTALSLGVPLILTAHGESRRSLDARGLSPLFQSGALKKVIALPALGRAEVYEADEWR